MSWTAGTEVSGYEIKRLLGAGGMGEVYLARNVRLQRDVALKVLPPSLIEDPERRARFEREARVLAALSHPNIAAIHGIEDMVGPGGHTPVLVLEFVDGRNLADRIGVGRIPLEEALPIALQIAEALEAAHERGIVHRDLKPQNVQLTREGAVKVLDFGLAKALDAGASGGPGDPAQSPTLTSASTQLGVIMGTAAYMAPEQARGKTVDRRADIWAFGALLFEMLSGARAFPGETISDTLAAVLTTTADWNALPSETPLAIRELIARCLDRDPRQRLQSIGEARIILSNPQRISPVGATVESKRRIPLATIAAIAIAITALLAVAALLWTPPTSAPASPVRKLDLALENVNTGFDRLPAISPDGTRVVYSAGGKLWIRSLADFASKEVPGTNGAVYPFWSRDGRELAFVRDFKLWRMPYEGGDAALVGAVPDDMSGSGAGVWTAAGNFLVVGSDAKGITEISAADGSSREVVPLDRKVEADFHEISELPGGRGVLFAVHSTQTDTIALFADGKRRDVIKLPGELLRSPVYHPAGYILYGRETTRRGVWAIRFSLDTLTTEGSSFLVDPAGTYPSVALDGTIVIVRRSALPSEFVWIDRSGSLIPISTLGGRVPDLGPWRMFGLSPDHQKVAVGIAAEGGDELWIYDLKRTTMSPVSQGAQMVVWPIWLPSGSRVLFGGFASGRVWNVHSVSAAQVSTPELFLPPSDEPQWPCDISSDGKWLLYVRSPSRNSDLWIAPLDRRAEGKPLMVTPAREEEGHLSPDARWLAYQSDESGRPELYVRRFPIDDHRIQVSNGGAGSITWSADGREVFYRGGGAMMAARITETGGRLEASTPQRLFVLSDPALSQTFIAAPDGQRFLFA
ncbi:MAG TPA: protein kinase, partial [Vicinamibacterales bacterium]|nr:protein kinase [Vicinamibacterales bacterium]